jgi:sugar phosphate isomerase/epimerase
MDYIFFSKMLQDQSIEQLIESLQGMGADGVDFTVRPGYPVHPDNVAEALAPAAQAIRAAGLSIPMVTTPGDFTNPALPYAEPLFRACGEADIRLVKLGYWSFPGSGYWKAVDRMKADVEGFARLGEKYGVKPCLHTHSGNCLALNASALMHVLREFSPEQVGAYLDPGHLALCGEPLPMAFDMAADWLALVAIKDSIKVRREDGSVRNGFLPLGEGFVDWKQMLQWLIAHDYAGPLSFHSEFPSESIEYLLEQTRKDIAYLRELERQVRAA